jgi:hypothetical protein
MMTTSPTEAWCPSCRVTHVPGTKRCIHCGGPVLPERPAAGGSSATPKMRPGTFSPWPAPPPDDAEAEEASTKARPLRIGMAAIWILLAILTGILRACSENG